MGIINQLDLHVANLIAAGEVVERPASCVKELVENALDAGANEITVEIKRGGVQFIRVTDNGCGIARDDLPVSLKRHATSKIKEAEDLDGIMTLGFRGEALAAISSVSEMRIMTKRDCDKEGSILTASFGTVTDISDAGCRRGTTVIVENLFANVPARRKFLKKDSSEAMAVIALVEKLALSRPDVSFRMISDNNQRFITSGDSKLRSAVYSVLGRDFASALYEVDSLTLGIEVKGFVGRPDVMRANRNYQIYFINGRYFKSRTVTAALEQGFDSFSEAGKFPSCVLMINLHPALVDVNVHPTKLEVKFSNERAVFDAVYCAVKNALMRTSESLYETTQMTPSERSYYNAFVPVSDKIAEAEDKGVKNQPEIEGSDFDAPPMPEIKVVPTYGENGAEQSTKREEIPSLAELGTEKGDSEPCVDMEKPERASEPKKTDLFSNLYGDIELDIPPVAPSVREQNKREEQAIRHTAAESADDSDNGIGREYFVGKTAITALGSDIIPKYRIIGVAFSAYIFVEIDEKTLVIDKHAAHERLIFESMRMMMASQKKAMQMLLVPITLTISPEEMAAAEEWGEDIHACGFEFSLSAEQGMISVTEIPSYLSQDKARDMLVTILGQLVAGTGSAEVTKNKFFEESLYQASCKSAMKAGIPDDDIHIKWLVESLLSLPDIKYCPHGRPIAFEMSKQDIEKFFKRT